jgi:PelA/Pel-15E family pectate lyase
MRWLVSISLLACLAVQAANHGAAFKGKPENWFRSEEGKRIIANVLSWQASDGGWPKNTDTFSVAFSGERAKLQGTFDNGATTDELRFLARAFNVTGNPACRSACERGVSNIITAQYANGGWPQYFPPPADKYHRYITFNDDAMVRLMGFVREVARSNSWSFLEAKQRASAQATFDRGIHCILKCQIKVNGKLTAWCAQHDEKDFSPRPARTFELASISGSESVDITRLLMSLEKPSPEIVRAVDAAAAWFENAKLPGIKVVSQPAPGTPKGTDKVVVRDATAKPMWARFYEIELNKPIFSGRDGVKKYSLAEIEYERRNGYAWLGYWPEPLLMNEYPAWKAKVAALSK